LRELYSCKRSERSLKKDHIEEKDLAPSKKNSQSKDLRELSWSLAGGVLMNARKRRERSVYREETGLKNEKGCQLFTSDINRRFKKTHLLNRMRKRKGTWSIVNERKIL